MRATSSIRSPHVVVFYGLCLEPHIAVVMEKCSYGSLDEVRIAHLLSAAQALILTTV
jgi:hypothetical protein